LQLGIRDQRPEAWILRERGPAIEHAHLRALAVEAGDVEAAATPGPEARHLVHAALAVGEA
jgi:hypothetical protein